MSEDRTILQLVNLHCSNSLHTFGISITNSHNHSISFEEFTKPFKKVEKLFLFGHLFDSLDTSTLNFNELFPNLQSLVFSEGFSLRNTSSLENLTFPHLKFLKIVIANDNVDGSERKLIDKIICKKLIKNNIQIEELILKYVNRNLLEFIANSLPLLRDFQLEYYSEQNVENAIHFENLKKFIQITAFTHTMPGMTTFGQLESLSVDGYFSRITDCRWFNVVTQNTLKTLDIFHHLTLNELTLLSNENTSLVSLQLDVSKFKGDEFLPKMKCILKIIENSEHLKDLMLYKGDGSVVNYLQERLSNKWTVKMSDDGNHLIVERN